jgi:hypothetical protein
LICFLTANVSLNMSPLLTVLSGWPTMIIPPSLVVVQLPFNSGTTLSGYRTAFMSLALISPCSPSAFTDAVDLGAPSLLTPLAATSIFLLLPFRLMTPLIVSFLFPLPH